MTDQDQPVRDYLSATEPRKRRRDAETLLGLMKRDGTYTSAPGKVEAPRTPRVD